MQPTARSILLLVVALSILSAPAVAERAPASAMVDESSGKRDLLTPAWETGIQEGLAAQEYRITWQDLTQLDDLSAAWHATNRAQGLRAYFTSQGITMIPRTSQEPAWKLSLSLSAFGRGSLSHPVEEASLFPEGNRIQLDRGEIVEWFVNGPQGLKHGFVLHARPDDGHDPSATGRKAHLDLMVRGSLTPVVEGDGQSVRFVGSSGLGVVYFADLEVHDASGRALPARIETYLFSNVWTIRLLVDDDRAVYPVTIDPLGTTAAWVGEVDQEGASFGISVGAAGDVNGDGYDDVIVGATHFDNGQINEGAAFLYLGSADGPSLPYVWMIEGNEAAAFAGRAVATAGDVNGDGYDDVIVGIPYLDPAGWARVFHGSPTGLAPEPDWAVKGINSSNGAFGFSVGTAGDVNGDGYDDVIVGAHLTDEDGPYLQDGRAYVYHGSASGLSIFPAWDMQGNQSSAWFGISVGTAGDVNGDGYDDVIVGAYRFDNGETDEGRAFVYHGSSSGVSAEPGWTFENDVVNACLGGSVGTAGDVNGDGYGDVIVGAAFNSCWDVGTSPLGRAYVFHGSAVGLPWVPDWIGELVQIGAAYGKVAKAGDVNSDGYDDVIVGASRYDNDLTDEGAAWLYLGSEAGLSTEHDWMVEGNQAESRFGFDPRAAGDVNGDSVGDVIIGAYKFDNGQDDEGAAFLFLGSSGIVPAGWVRTDTPLLLAKTESAAIRFTWATSCLTSDLDYEVYEGQIGDFESHAARICSTEGATETTFLPAEGGRYYLVVPASRNGEGSYGTDSEGLERAPGPTACLPQAIGNCAR